jgi:hypothetical protein
LNKRPTCIILQRRICSLSQEILNNFHLSGKASQVQGSVPFIITAAELSTVFDKELGKFH